ncbi:MAG TPA: RNA 2',3'-cyclic phosphodiesterase [Solirubrobacteraceae bacterium]|nr:RNA 2',3'-cyclic phosphodiesterase [Solirubrobacteraceae bacterium]
MSEERERVRLFVALELPRDARAMLVEWRERVPGGREELRLLAPESLHVTLCFLGWRWADEIPAIAAATEVVGSLPAAELVIGPPVWLPPNRPRVLAVELEDRGEALGRAQAALSRVLAAGGWFVAEKRPFFAHVTVARVRKDARVRDKELPGPPVEALRATTITLFRSRLQRGGAQYEALHSVQLGSSRATRPG